MLTRATQTRLQTTLLRGCARRDVILPRPGTLILAREYTRSRYRDKLPGVARLRDRPEKIYRKPELLEQQSYDTRFQSEQPSAEESPLWEASQRPPPGDPEEGLQRLLLENNILVITRQLEMLNVFVGFEQANRYVISNVEGELLGYIAEEASSVFSRQILRTHRPFRAVVMDASGTPILSMRRPFAWLTSRMYVERLKDFKAYTSEEQPVLEIIGEAHQKWHLWRRRYELFLKETPRRILTLASEEQSETEQQEILFTQIASINEGLWAWHFNLRDAQGAEIARVDKIFRGFGREIFTDTNRFFVSFGPRHQEVDGTQLQTPPVVRNLTLDERALVLAMAVNLDFDYFSTGRGMLGSPLIFLAEF